MKTLCSFKKEEKGYICCRLLLIQFFTNFLEEKSQQTIEDEAEARSTLCSSHQLRKTNWFLSSSFQSGKCSWDSLIQTIKLHLRAEGGYQAGTRLVGQPISEWCPPVLEDHNHGTTCILSLCNGRPRVPHAAPTEEPLRQRRVRGWAGKKLRDKARQLQLN